MQQQWLLLTEVFEHWEFFGLGTFSESTILLAIRNFEIFFWEKAFTRFMLLRDTKNSPTIFVGCLNEFIMWSLEKFCITIPLHRLLLLLLLLLLLFWWICFHRNDPDISKLTFKLLYWKVIWSHIVLYSFDKEINERSFFGLQGIVKLLAGKGMNMTSLKDSKQPRLKLAATQAEYYKLKNDVSFWSAQKVYDWQNSK